MEEYEELREEHYAGQEERHYLVFEKAQSKGLKIDFAKRPPAPAPLKPGVTVTTGKYELDDVLEYIDWNPFFQVCLGVSSFRPAFFRGFCHARVFCECHSPARSFSGILFFAQVLRCQRNGVMYVDGAVAYTTQSTQDSPATQPHQPALRNRWLAP